MKNAPVRHRLEYAAYLAVRRLILTMNHARVRSFGHALGRLAHRLDAKHRRVALDNVAAVMPEIDGSRREQLVRRCFEHFGAAFSEVISASRFSQEEVLDHFDIDGWEHVEAATAQGRGVVIISGHYGAWQIAVYPMGILLGGIHLVARPPDNPHIAADALRIRERFGNTQVERGGSAHRMLNIVRRGNVIGLVVDQRPPSGGIVVPFLGREARATPIPAMVSTFARAPAVPMTCVPLGADRYRLSLRPAIQPEGRGDEAVAALTERYLDEVTAEIRTAPEMWLWMHRRWEM